MNINPNDNDEINKPNTPENKLVDSIKAAIQDSVQKAVKKSHEYNSKNV